MISQARARRFRPRSSYSFISRGRPPCAVHGARPPARKCATGRRPSPEPSHAHSLKCPRTQMVSLLPSALVASQRALVVHLTYLTAHRTASLLLLVTAVDVNPASRQPRARRRKGRGEEYAFGWAGRQQEAHVGALLRARSSWRLCVRRSAGGADVQSEQTRLCYTNLSTLRCDRRIIRNLDKAYCSELVLV
jgi:hypothetical protein